MPKTKFSIEDAFNQLDTILETLEDPNLTLEDSLTLYKKGVKLLDKCGQTLDKTEKELQILQEGKDKDAGQYEGNAGNQDSPN